MKVIVLCSYGNEGLPKEFGCNYKDKLWRFDKKLINRIEKLDWIKIDFPNNIKDTTKNYCYKVSNGVKYIYATPNSHSLFNIFKIVEVDISRPWCIEEYDGAEGIKYLDDYICVDKELNYFEFKN